MFDEDITRLLESRHDIQAVTDPAKLTDKPVYQAAVAASRDELAAARADLVEAVAHNSRELSETDVERARIKRHLTGAREHYRYYRGRAKDALLNPPPSQPVDAEELFRRERLFDRYYGQTGSDLKAIGFDKQVEWLDALLVAYKAEDDLKSLGHLGALETAFRPAIDAVKEYAREVKEDVAATGTLDEMRAALGRAHAAHIAQVESLLTRAGRKDAMRDFIKRRDPAYAARRRANAPAAQEPEASVIEAEIRGGQPVTV